MFESVLIPTDFSPYADKTLECGLELKSLGMKDVVLLHVIDPEITEYVDALYGVDVPTLLEDIREKARAKLEERVKMLRDQGINARYEIAIGDPATEIVKASEGFSLILMGAKGKNALSATFLGSVSEAVIRSSKIPVLITKLRVVERKGAYYCELMYGRLFDKVLYATDFSEYSKVVEIIDGYPKEIVVLHVLEGGEDLDEARSRLKDIGLKNAEYIVMKGKPCKSILNVGDDMKCTLIVVGRSKVEGFFGTTVDCVVRRSEIPVLIV